MPSETNDPMQALLEQQQALFKQWIDEQTTSAACENIPPHESQDLARVSAILATQTTEFLRFGQTILEHTGKSSSNSSTLKVTIEGPLKQFRDFVQQQTGEALLKQWKLPENVAALFRKHSFSDDILFENPYISGLKSLLNTPSVGTTHELQKNTSDGIKLLLEYQDSLAEYIEQYSQINLHTSHALMQELIQGSKSVETLGELHNLWVNCYEAAYSECLYTQQYQQSHGRVSNALMHLRKYAQDMRDIQFEAVGLATRKGLDTALQRQHALRKDMRKMNKTLADIKEVQNQILISELKSTVQQLSSDINDLKQELSELKSPTLISTLAGTDEKS
ncbi:poly(R)-hydroxyalkanoic acid synthase subunit PhaE [Neptunomonas japonica]|uniref:poly(R)-hydroxyalkanoic acid synthase subunit PhaE n=1 Tax=Neptunomonas japonica TaxID=417574 RepID=UPI00048FF725|nr:poly(R)-hydroxyalkanoic acid synthase subunit PhaE [Neptunomonas japonica]